MCRNPDTLLLVWPLDLLLSYVLMHTQEVCLMLSDEVPVNLLDLPVSWPVACPLACLSTCLSVGLGCAHPLASLFVYQLTSAFRIGSCSGLSSASCWPCNLPFDLKTTRKSKDYIFWCQSDEKLSVIPGCPGQLICSRCAQRRCITPSTWSLTACLQDSW